MRRVDFIEVPGLKRPPCARSCSKREGAARWPLPTTPGSWC